MKFHLGYEDAKGRTVLDFKSVALHYVKAPLGFVFDVVTTMPFEVVMFAVPYGAVWVSVIQYCALVHVLRTVRLKGLFDTEQMKLNQK